MSILSKIEELSNRCNDIARLLAVHLTQNSFIQPICYDIPNTSNFCVFHINCYYDKNSQFYDANIIADNILKYFTTVCKTHKFEDIYVNGIDILCSDFISIKLGEPYITLDKEYKGKSNLLSFWESLLEFNIHSPFFLKGCRIINNYYNKIEKEQKQCEQVISKKRELAKLALDLYYNSPKGVEDYITLILANSFYFFEFNCNPLVEYNETNKSIVIEYYLPKLNEIPNSIYNGRKNKLYQELSLSAHNKLYDDIIYKIVIRSIAEIYHFDLLKKIDTIFFNGRIKSKSEATGKDIDNCIVSISVNREKFEDIDLDYIEAKACFKYLKGVSASKIYNITPVTPILTFNKKDKRFVEGKDIEVNQGTNLAAMHWEDFEHLVRELFEMEFARNGGEVRVTQASRDGGVDAIVFDPDPLRGGKIVIQAKRYTNTVGVSAVRDLYGTVINEGANTGILITTSDYGHDSYEFAKNKPLKLLNGGHLLALLQKNGRKAHINIEEAKKIMNEK